MRAVGNPQAVKTETRDPHLSFLSQPRAGSRPHTLSEENDDDAHNDLHA